MKVFGPNNRPVAGRIDRPTSRQLPIEEHTHVFAGDRLHRTIGFVLKK